MSDQDLLEKEDAAVLDDTAKDFSPQEQAEFGALGGNDPNTPSDQAGSGFRKEKKKFWSRRKKISTTLAVATVTSLLASWIILVPGITVNHLRNLLMGSDLQVSHSRRYRRTHFAKMSDAFSKDGRRGGKIINEMQQRGYKFSFDPNDRNRIVGITLPGQTVSIRNLDNGALADHIEGYINTHHPLRFSRWKTKRMEAFYDRYKVSRSSVTTPKPDSDLSDPERTVNKEIADQVVGEEPETRVTGTGPDGEETEEETRAREQREANGTANAGGDGSYDDIKRKLKEGVPLSELTQEEQALLRVSDQIDDELIRLIQNADPGSVAGRTVSSIKGLGTSTDVLDKVCITKNRLRAISFAARNYRALGLIRYASVFIKAGDAVRTGQTDAKLLNELMKRTTAVDANGVGIGGSPGFAYLVKNKFSKSQNDLSRSNVSVDGKLTGIAAALQDSTDKIWATGQRECRLYQNPVFQVGVAVVEIGAAIFTGGTSAGVSQTGSLTFRTALKKALNNIITKKTAGAVAKTIAVELTFEGALSLLEFYTEKAQSLNFTGQEEAVALGDVLGGGSGALTKQRGLQSGMVPATTAQYAVANEQYIAESREALKHQSLFARMFDHKNPDSLAYKMLTVATTTPVNTVGMGLGLRNTIETTASTIWNPLSWFSGIGGMAAPKVSAQTDDEIAYDEIEIKGTSLATDPAGNLLPIMRQDILDIDPVENAKYLAGADEIDPNTEEPSSENFKKHIVNCVDSPDTIGMLENHEPTDPQYDCLATQDITIKYKAHLAWLDMKDGIDGYAFPEEIATGTSESSTSTTNPSSPTVGDTANVACAPGTTDVGETDGYSGGQKYRIRLCEIPGFVSESQEDPNGLVQINSTASGNWLQLFQQAKAAGTTLKAKGSFRTMERQQYFYNCMITGSCNSGNEAAKPGYSNHQIGFAVDVDIVPGSDPSLTTCKANPDRYPVYKTLAALGPPLGIEGKVQSECWHWSVGGG